MTGIDDQVAQSLTDERLADDVRRIASDVRFLPPEERTARLNEAARRISRPMVQVLITLNTGRQVFLSTTDPQPRVQYRTSVSGTWTLPLEQTDKPHKERTFYVGEW